MNLNLPNLPQSLVDLTRERLKRRPVHITLGRRRFRVTRPLLAALVRWWRP